MLPIVWSDCECEDQKEKHAEYEKGEKTERGKSEGVEESARRTTVGQVSAPCHQAVDETGDEGCRGRSSGFLPDCSFSLTTQLPEQSSMSKCEEKNDHAVKPSGPVPVLILQRIRDFFLRERMGRLEGQTRIIAAVGVGQRQVADGAGHGAHLHRHIEKSSFECRKVTTRFTSHWRSDSKTQIN